MRCSTPQFSDHWLSLFPPTLSVPYENKKDERERLFAKIGRLEMELDWLKKIGLMAKYIRPYLLRGLLIDRPNQVWAIDITYIPVAKGFLYLTAAMDVYSRYVVAWDLHNSLDATHVLNVLKKAVSTHGHPEIINSDQGSQLHVPFGLSI